MRFPYKAFQVEDKLRLPSHLSLCDHVWFGRNFKIIPKPEAFRSQNLCVLAAMQQIRGVGILEEKDNFSMKDSKYSENLKRLKRARNTFLGKYECAFSMYPLSWLLYHFSFQGRLSTWAGLLSDAMEIATKQTRLFSQTQMTVPEIDFWVCNIYSCLS